MHAHVQRLVSVVKMPTLLESILPKSSVLLCIFLWAKGLNAEDIHKCFLFTVGSVCDIKRFITGLRNSLKDVRKSQMMSDQVALLRMRQKQLCSRWKS
jgi:hypothetical protein